MATQQDDLVDIKEMILHSDLVEELLNCDEGEYCFLCQETGEKECIFDEVGAEILAAGEEVFNQEMANPTFGDCACKQARFACYRKYVFTVTDWMQGMTRIRLPVCVEAKIKTHFYGDGNFVGFIGSDDTAKE